MAKSPRPRPRPKKTPDRAPSGRRKGILRTILKWAGAAAVWLVIAALAAGVWVSIGLPDLDEALKTERRPTVTILAADGTELYRAGDLVGETVALKDLPPHLAQAVLATEDRRFYNHFGIDPIGLGRALVRNIRAGRVVEGGSTITQQLAKNLFLTPARTIVRKVQEMVVALWLEWEFSKDQIPHRARQHGGRRISDGNQGGGSGPRHPGLRRFRPHGQRASFRRLGAGSGLRLRYRRRPRHGGQNDP